MSRAPLPLRLASCAAATVVGVASVGGVLAARVLGVAVEAYADGRLRARARHTARHAQEWTFWNQPTFDDGWRDVGAITGDALLRGLGAVARATREGRA